MVDFVSPMRVFYMDIEPGNRPKMTFYEALAFVSEMSQKTPKPESYKWKGKWWRLHARESKARENCVMYARGQMALYHDMQARPEHYTSAGRPDGMTDWLWSGLRYG